MYDLCMVYYKYININLYSLYMIYISLCTDLVPRAILKG